MLANYEVPSLRMYVEYILTMTMTMTTMTMTTMTMTIVYSQNYDSVWSISEI